MNPMSVRIEQVAGARLNELGIPVKIYHHKRYDRDKANTASEHDCLSCQKHTTHIIPNNKRCKAICGNKVTILIGRKPIITKAEIRAILKMNDLIQQTEQQRNICTNKKHFGKESKRMRQVRYIKKKDQ
jgi:hypothetical protein